MENAKIENVKPVGWLPSTEKLPGVFLCIVIAGLAYLTNFFVYGKVSPLMYAFLYAILFANMIPLPITFNSGIDWSSQSWLRFSIAMMGFTISALAWLQLGVVGVIQILIVITFALLFGVWLGRKMGLSPELSILMGAGSSICGASAIAALAPVVKPKDEEIGVSVATITLFGLFAMVLYPYLFQSTILGDLLNNSQIAFGMWAGTGIHETAQVIPAGAQVGKEAEAMAIIAKSVRIFSIAPVVLISGYLLGRLKGGKDTKLAKVKLGIPTFAIFFVIFSLINSLLLYFPSTQSAWKSFYNAINYSEIVKVFLAVAFAGVGFKVNFNSIKKIGFKAFFVGMALAISVGLLALLLVYFVYMPYNQI